MNAEKVSKGSYGVLYDTNRPVPSSGRSATSVEKRALSPSCSRTRRSLARELMNPYAVPGRLGACVNCRRCISRAVSSSRMRSPPYAPFWRCTSMNFAMSVAVVCTGAEGALETHSKALAL
jgi:hypothetical protein